MTARALLRLGACLALASSCASEDSLTQIVVAIDSDIDAIESVVVATENFSARESAIGRLGGDQPGFPRSLGLVHEGGPLGPIVVRVTGLDRDDEVLAERHARVFFEQAEVRLLRLELTRNCKRVYASCADDETCVDGACASDTARMEPWTGEVPDGWL